MSSGVPSAQGDKVSYTLHLRSSSILRGVLSSRTSTQAGAGPVYHISTIDGRSTIFEIHPLEGWARTIGTVRWTPSGRVVHEGQSQMQSQREATTSARGGNNGGSGSGSRDRSAARVEFGGKTFLLRDLFPKPGSRKFKPTFTNPTRTIRTPLPISWRRCVSPSLGYPYSVFVASIPTSAPPTTVTSASTSAAVPTFVAQLTYRYVRSAAASTPVPIPALIPTSAPTSVLPRTGTGVTLDLHLELRTRAQDLIDTIIFSTLLLFAYKFDWDDLDNINLDDSVGIIDGAIDNMDSHARRSGVDPDLPSVPATGAGASNVGTSADIQNQNIVLNNRRGTHPDDGLVPYEMIVPSSMSPAGSPPPINNFSIHHLPPPALAFAQGAVDHMERDGPVPHSDFPPPPAYSTT